LAKQNGAHHVLLTTDSSADNVKKILDLTDGKGVHAVYDGVGKDTFDEDFEVVRSRGTLVMYGNASVCLSFSSSVQSPRRRAQADKQGAPAEFSVLRLSSKSLKITRPTLGAFISTPEDFASYSKEVLDWIKDGHLKVNRLICRSEKG
jgi:NADPH2:quinone reductase